MFVFVTNYTKLLRFKTSFLIGLSSLLGAWFYVNEYNVKLTYNQILLKLIAVFLLLLLSSGSLNLFNDIIDLKIDKELKPERILPQGSVSIFQAYIFFFILAITCLILSLSLNILILVIFITMFSIGVFYSLFLQNIPLVKNFVVALSISLSIIVGYLSLVTNNEIIFSTKMFIIFILALFSIFAFELQKDINDVEIDKKFNKKTFPVVFGKKNSSILIYCIYWILAIIFWVYLIVIHSVIIIIIVVLICIQFVLLFSIHNIINDQSFDALESARIRIYILFTITLVFLFILK